MLTDRRGLGLSTDSVAARDAYVEGVEALLEANAGSDAAIANALEADPGFALAHAAQARLAQLDMRPADARAAAERARECVTGTSARERSHVEAIATLVGAVRGDALAAAKAHLAEHPRDAMVLAPCTGVFGLIGFSGREGREGELLALMRDYLPHYAEDGWFIGQLAFAEGEADELAAGERHIAKALALTPRSAHNAHVRAHLHYERGEDAVGLAYLEDWMRGYPRDAMLHCHLSWHVALWRMQAGDAEGAAQVYVAQVHPATGDTPPGSWGPSLNTLTDAASFLWRAELNGAARDAQRWDELRAYALRIFPKAGISFADVHSALAYAAAGDAGSLAALLEQLTAREAAGKLAAGPVVPALAAGFSAFARGEWAAAAMHLAAGFPDHARIGGSRAQRDLVEYTLAAALARSDRMDEAQALAAARRQRPAGMPVVALGG